MVIEIDGLTHKYTGENDIERENYLISLGLKIFRIPVGDILKNMDFVLLGLEDFIIRNYGNSTTPSLRDTPPKEGNLAFPPLEKSGQGEFSMQPPRQTSSDTPPKEGNLGEYNVNASMYDIREYFQGRNDKGKMNNKSDDETYMALITALRDKLKLLAKKIEPKVYEYGFLKE